MNDTRESNFFKLKKDESKVQDISSSEGKEEAFLKLKSPENTWVKPEQPPIKEQLKNAPGFFQRELASDLYAAPSNAAETWRYLAGKASEIGEQQQLKEGKERPESETKLQDWIVNAMPDFIEELGIKYPKIFPNRSEARRVIEEQIVCCMMIWSLLSTLLNRLFYRLLLFRQALLPAKMV